MWLLVETITRPDLNDMYWNEKDKETSASHIVVHILMYRQHWDAVAVQHSILQLRHRQLQ